MKGGVRMAKTTVEVDGLNLIQKLAGIRRMADVVKKNKKGYNYTYADINEILAKITAGMDTYRVTLIPVIVPDTTEVEQLTIVNTKFDKQGKTYDQTSTEMLVTGDMIFRWINDDNPTDTLDVPWYLTGSQTDPSQAFGSGLTYTKRYFLTNFFNIAQDDNDPEQYRKKKKEAAEAEDLAVAKEIIDQVDTIVKAYLGANPDKRDDVTKFMAKYIKGSNYNKITSPEVAAKLLEDFQNTYK